MGVASTGGSTVGHNAPLKLAEAELGKKVHGNKPALGFATCSDCLDPKRISIDHGRSGCTN